MNYSLKSRKKEKEYHRIIFLIEKKKVGSKSRWQLSFLYESIQKHSSLCLLRRHISHELCPKATPTNKSAWSPNNFCTPTVMTSITIYSLIQFLVFIFTLFSENRASTLDLLWGECLRKFTYKKRRHLGYTIKVTVESMCNATACQRES